MPTDQRTLPGYFSNNADFQAWVQGLQAQLATAVSGLVKTADTGQINSATVAAPTTGSSQGYEIYRFNDTLQATAPVFLKIEYGAGNTDANHPGIWLTVGTGTNGAGTLTGQLSQRQFVCVGANGAVGVTWPSYCCGKSDGSGFVLVNNYNNGANNYPIGLLVERTRDGSGNATSDGVIVVWFGSRVGTNAYPHQHQVVPPAGTVPGPVTAGQIGPQVYDQASAVRSTLGGGASIFGTNVAMMPYMTLLGKLLYGMMMGLFNQADVTQQVSVSVSTFGGTHTYMPLGQVLNPANDSASASSFAMLWE